MQASSISRRFPWTLARVSFFPDSPYLALASDSISQELHTVHSSAQWSLTRSFSSFQPNCRYHSGAIIGRSSTSALTTFSPTIGAFYSSESSKESAKATEAVEELYQKMLKSIVESRSCPPNAWLWSMVNSCSNKEDIKLLFQILQRLRIFRLSNLRIHENFNCHLCLKVSEACARANAFDYGLKTLWKHNVYGITPSVGSANYLLLHAKENNDTKLMEKIMQAIHQNSLPLQPGTADIVFSVCYNKDKWEMLCKYASRFIKAGVKLHRTAFDVWMDFAAKLGDSKAIWKINSIRGELIKQHTPITGFACAKGFLLERKPESAAAAIQLLYKKLPDKKKPQVKDELQKLISEWPAEVVKRQKKEERKTLAESLRNDIPIMVNSILSMGLDLTVNLEELALQEV